MEETPASSAGVATEEGAAAEVCGASMAANVADEPASGAPPPAAAAESAPAPTASGAAPAPAAGAPTKRRSRWGGKVDVASESARNGVAKKSRWGAKKTVTDPVQLAVQLGLPLATLQHMSAEQQQTLPQIKERMDEIDLLMQLPDCGASEIPAHQRPPSPEPIFDKAGTQVNSAGARRRQQLEAERAELVEALKPRAAQRCWRKLIVPVDKYPGYNFFGALIGPRGNAQKRMERESGCKIVIRGRGAIKDGMGRHDGKPLGPEDEEPMHVLIEAPDEASVEKGQKMIEIVLNPYSEDAVTQKEKQMKELAIINGTLKEEDVKALPPTQ